LTTHRQETRFPVPDGAPQRTRIKFCGFTRQQDIDVAVRLGADAIGLVCVPGSKRELSLAQAAQLRASVPGYVATVLLLSNADGVVARAAIDAVQPDFVQFHGSEPAAFCDRFARPYFKSVAVNDAQDIRRAAQDYPQAAALLLDSHGDDGMGGTGQRFDWTQAMQDVGKALILAGGLKPDNVGEAVRMLTPYAVDVSSGIESAPGRKDFAKMKAFVEAVRLADSRLGR
jgi:phosphoribosylanthranilate isomerase